MRVVPAVRVQHRLPQYTFEWIPGLLRDAAGLPVLGRVVEHQPVQPERPEAPVLEHPNGQPSKPATPRTRHHPVRQPGRSFHQIDAPQPNLAERLVILPDDRPTGGVLLVPPARPLRHPSARLILVVDPQHMPPLDLRATEPFHHRRDIPHPPRPEGDRLIHQPRLRHCSKCSHRKGRLNKTRHATTLRLGGTSET